MAQAAPLIWPPLEFHALFFVSDTARRLAGRYSRNRSFIAPGRQGLVTSAVAGDLCAAYSTPDSLEH